MCVPSPPAPNHETRHGAHPCRCEAEPAVRQAESRRARWLVRLVVALVATGAVARASVAANDHYLDATPIFTERFHETVETNEAGEQPDLFVPSAPGRPGGGNMPEPLSCRGQAYGKTVWYDFLAPADGGVRITALGFDAVIAVYEYDARTARIIRSLGCSDASKATTEELTVAGPRILKGHRYAVQVGGAGTGGAAQSGVLNFGFEFVADRDGDGAPDASDRCPGTAGPQDGCPSEIPGTPRLSVAGLRIMQLEWAGLPRGAEVRARCARCGPHGISQTVRVGDGATARLSSFGRKSARRGAVLEVFARSPAAGAAAAPGAAIGKTARYRFGSGARHWKIGCLAPGSWTRRVACPQ